MKTPPGAAASPYVHIEPRLAGVDATVRFLHLITADTVGGAAASSAGTCNFVDLRFAGKDAEVCFPHLIAAAAVSGAAATENGVFVDSKFAREAVEEHDEPHLIA
eukprot:1159877-Pelagomonas_calceolata.AAC.17